MLSRDARDMVVALRGKPSRQPEQREQARALAVLRSPELMAGPVAAAIAVDPGHRVGETIRDTLAGLNQRKAPSASGSRVSNAAAGVAGVPPADFASARMFKQAIQTAASGADGPQAPILKYLDIKGGTGKAQMRTARGRSNAAGVSFATPRKERKDSLVTNAVILEAVQGK